MTKIVHATSGLEARRDSRFALAVGVCAVAFVTLLGASRPAPVAGPATVAVTRSAPASRAPAGQFARQEAGVLHALHVGAPQPASPDHLDPAGHSIRPPSPPLPRLDTLRALLARYDHQVLAHAQGLLARALPPRLTPLADRPRTVNCPARGPPAQG